MQVNNSDQVASSFWLISINQTSLFWLTTISLFVPAVAQKRLRRERRARRRLQEQLETEVKRRMQLEEALKATGAVEQLRIINGAYRAVLILFEKRPRAQYHRVAFWLMRLENYKIMLHFHGECENENWGTGAVWRVIASGLSNGAEKNRKVSFLYEFGCFPA